MRCAHISDITHPNPCFGGMVPLRMSSIVSAVALLDVACIIVLVCIGLLYPHPLICDIASQYVRFCSVNSGVLLRLKNRVWARVTNSISFFKYYSRVRVRVSLLKFLIILAVTLPSCEWGKGVRIMGVGILVAVCTCIKSHQTWINVQSFQQKCTQRQTYTWNVI